MRTLDVGMDATEPAYRPPDGRQIAFTGSPTGDPSVLGTYVVNADGTGLRTLIEASREASSAGPRWSPDGSQLAYSTVDFTVQHWTVQVRVMLADGSRDRGLPAPADAKFTYSGAWSNDGSRLAMLRGYASVGNGDNVAVVVPADGSGTGVESIRPLFPGQDMVFEWAPDDSSLIVTAPGSNAGPLLMDPMTGTTSPAWTTTRPAWTTRGPAGWQRVAP